MPSTEVGHNHEGHSTFQQQCLAAHNELRKEHGCPALKWSKDLADHAQSWAEKLAEKGRVLYAENAGVGENIALFTNNGKNVGTMENGDAHEIISTDHPEEIDGNEPVRMWARERDHYDFEKGCWQRKAHNFTQMIWKSTTELGVSKAITKDGKSSVVVAFYKPAGNSNKEGDFAKNVPRIAQF